MERATGPGRCGGKYPKYTEGETTRPPARAERWKYTNVLRRRPSHGTSHRPERSGGSTPKYWGRRGGPGAPVGGCRLAPPAPPAPPRRCPPPAGVVAAARGPGGGCPGRPARRGGPRSPPSVRAQVRGRPGVLACLNQGFGCSGLGECVERRRSIAQRRAQGGRRQHSLRDQDKEGSLSPPGHGGKHGGGLLHPRPAVPVSRSAHWRHVLGLSSPPGAPTLIRLACRAQSQGHHGGDPETVGSH